MSIKLMTKVWENGPEDRTETMVLLALADRANDDGSSCFPSVAEVSQRSRLSRRGTQKVIRRLEDKGFLTVDENSGPGGTNNYQLHPARLEGRTECTGRGEHDSPGGERHSPGGEPDDEKGRSTFARNRHEPSTNRQEDAPARGGEAASFSELVATWREIDATPHLRQRHEQTFQQWAKEGVIDDLNTFREVLEEDAKEVRDKDCGLSLSVTRQNYEEQTSVLSAKRQDDPDWSVIDGEPAFKGVPISQIGPQNVYDEQKDGSARPEPEVSAA